MRNAIIHQRCPCCGQTSGLPFPLDLRLARYAAGYGRLRPCAGGYATPVICGFCAAVALLGDSAPSGRDMPSEFYHALALEV